MSTNVNWVAAACSPARSYIPLQFRLSVWNLKQAHGWQHKGRRMHFDETVKIGDPEKNESLSGVSTPSKVSSPQNSTPSFVSKLLKYLNYNKASNSLVSNTTKIKG